MRSNRLVLGLLLVIAVGLSPGCASPPEFNTAPELAANPDTDVPLAAILTAQTDRPTVLSVQIREGDALWEVPTSDEFSTSHELPLLGFRVGKSHVVEVSAADAQGLSTGLVQLSFDAPALPEGTPGLEITVSEPDRMEPGVTLFSLMKWPDGEDSDESYGLTLAVDATGHVVWYRRSTPANISFPK